MIDKTVEVNLYDQFMLYDGVPFRFYFGFRHQTLDTIFIITPQFLKHQLYALGSRDVGFPKEETCSNSNCFGSNEVMEEKHTKLCSKHAIFFEKYLTDKFAYTLNPIIFCDEERFELLTQASYDNTDMFSRQTGIPVKLNKGVRKDRSVVNDHWLICLREDGYKYHERDFRWDEYYKNELEMNNQSKPGNLAINIFNISDIAEYGSLENYRKMLNLSWEKIKEKTKISGIGHNPKDKENKE